ncbi:MAG: hypothetical protein AAFW89_06145 [Bacteroidota bacterium]
MGDLNESEYQAFLEDVHFFIKTLKESFESSDAEFHMDEANEILYIKLEGLGDYTEQEIEEIAEPIFEELDLDFEEIILLPL